MRDPFWDRHLSHPTRYSDCDCHDFCNGEYVGCTTKDDEIPFCPEGRAVRGCPAIFEEQVERTLAETVNFGGGFVDPCPEGSFSNGPGFPCVNCLQCSRNAFPLVACVKNAADPTQCQCESGFRPNGRGGCPPDRTIAGGSLDPVVCAVGEYRPDPNGPCVPCLSCGDNAFPRTNCVIDTTDPNQCGCFAGYFRSNGVCIAVGGGSVEPPPCPEGTFRSSPDPNAPCVACLSCPWNASPRTNCVQNAADPNQCQCNPGFFPNGRGGCLRVGPGEPCAVGDYRPDPNGPCVPCLSCGDNAFPRTNCVTDTTDPSQCGCSGRVFPIQWSMHCRGWWVR